MNTCLSSLWDVLIERYYSTKQDETVCKEIMNSVINTFYNDGILHKPMHLKIFHQELTTEGVSIFNAAEKVVNEAETCDLCMVCNGCAKIFYDMLMGKRPGRPLPIELGDYFFDGNQFYYYLSAYKTVKSYRRINDALICLKGFSSTTPAIYSAAFEGSYTGGGLYLNVDGFGIAIDPGIGFVDSMHKQGIFIEDINAVIVTHNHLDHNAEVGTISALQYDINRYYDSQVKFYKNLFPEIKSKEHTINWWLDEGTQENNKGTIPKSMLLSQCSSWIELNEKISLIAIETKHMRDAKSYGIKCKIKLENEEIIVGYTSDTKYFSELEDFMKECKIIVFHISDIYEKDVRGIKQKNTHLGYDGSIHLLAGENQTFHLAIASEFCCNNGDYRVKVTRKLSEHVRKKRAAYVVPGEVGLKVDIRSGGIYCSRCKRIMKTSEILIVCPEREFGEIQYVCEKCRYK